MSDVADGFIVAVHQAGNAVADYFTVQARKSAEASSPTGKFVAHYTRARAWYKTVFGAIADWKEDVSAHLVQVPDSQEQEVVDRRPVSSRRRHEIWAWKRAWLCRTCGRTFPAECGPEKLEKAWCRGAMHSRLLHSMGALEPLGE